MSEEQNTYITNPDVTGTKLLAVAGSGKTRCILFRMQHLVEHLNYRQDSVIMATFSKNARHDFLSKARKNKVLSVDRSNCYTIDSLAFRSLASPTDVSILSYSFMIMLQTSDPEQIRSSSAVLSRLEHIFVDEAQDLNATQYNILLCLKEKLRVTIHLVGDPAQNIFQFRSSSDKYLLNFQANTFYLSTNYRSSPQIVRFSSCLRTHSDKPIHVAKPVTKSEVRMISVRHSDDFERTLVTLIETYIRLMIPLEKCAIIAPTRGKIRDTRGLPSYIGLCYVANLLFQHGIPFSQFYSDSDSKIKYKPAKGCVNLVTYHGAKGLEWNNVIVVDANAYLISRAGYSKEAFVAEQYLMYVACSRAVHNMVVITKTGMTSPWFDLIPARLYKTTGTILKIFDKHKLDFNPRSDTFPRAVTRVIAALPEKVLWEISEILGVCVAHTTSNLHCECGIWGDAVIEDESKRMLLGCVMENYFMTCSLQRSVLDTPLLANARNIVDESNVILCIHPSVSRWYLENKELLCWDVYDRVKHSVDETTRKFVLTHFDRSIPFGGYTLVDKFYKHYVDKNRDQITRRVHDYVNDPLSFDNTFYVTVINYAIGTNNYFFIEQMDQIHQRVCTASVLNIAKSTLAYCTNTVFGTVKSLQQVVCNDAAQGVIDFTDIEDRVCEIKCVKNVALGHVLQVFMYALMKSNDDQHAMEFIIYNLYDGTKHVYAATVPDDIRKRLHDLTFYDVTNQPGEPS